MRQIKFGGKRKDNGEWVYGFYFEAPLTHETGDCASYLCGEKRYLISQGGVTFDVLPETVGQFTGLCDGTKWEDLTEAERESWVRQGNSQSEWHGKEIYEGDILENINMKYKEHKNAVVEWAGHRYILRCLCGVVFNHGFENISISEIKVIGNIHEEIKP